VGAGVRVEVTRYAIVYVALFLVIGIHLPYWPTWLADRGMDADRIGWLLGVAMWARLVAPWVGAWVDRTGRGAQLLPVLAVGLLLCLLAFDRVDGFAALMLVSLAMGFCFAPIVPLVDGLVLRASAEGRLDYGRVRLWGSLSFVAASIVGGWWLDDRSPALVLALLQVSALVLVLSSLRLPSAPRVITPSATVPVVEVLRQPGVLVFLGATGCLQAGHAVLYGFATKHWLAMGIDEATIGWLWATGVFAEIALFAVSQRVLARIGPASLLCCAAVGAAVRWSALAVVDDPLSLFALQVLHAASFAGMHLGAMGWIRGTLDGASTQRATALYVAVGGGLALGVAMPVAGILYERFHGAAYHAMTLLSLVGLVLAARLRVR
jgi:PPP family 3-phenylpropionic acid transporter